MSTTSYCLWTSRIRGGKKSSEVLVCAAIHGDCLLGGKGEDCLNSTRQCMQISQPEIVTCKDTDVCL